LVLLIGFAFVAGVGTAVSPCALPILPIALSAGATGGSRRPLGIVTGLAVSFTFATVAAVYVIHALGLPNDLLRDLAIAGLLAFGLALVVPAVGDRMEAWLQRVAPKPHAGRERAGFGSGLLVGASLGLVYAPCAGPILAGVITVSASQTFTAGRLATAIAYGIGSAAALYALMLGGRRFTRRLASRSGRLQQALGAVMVVVAGLMLANLDTRFQNAVAQDLPSFLVDPTSGLEKSHAISHQLASLQGHPKGPGTRGATGPSVAGLRDYGPAVEISGTQRWFNTPGGRPLNLAALRSQHRVVLIDFWTYTCINCIRTLPQLEAWDSKYRRDGLTIIGVHTPEFPFEKDASNVSSAISQDGIRYPVVQDNDQVTWNAYGNQYWPAEYLIDSNGEVRYRHFGEGEYGRTEAAIRAALAAAGARRLGASAGTVAQVPSAQLATPETYLGSARAQGFVNGPIVDGSQDFGPPPPGLPLNALAYSGAWTISPENAIAGPGARLDLSFQAQRVYLVLGSPGRPRAMRVLLDGHPISARLAGPDVHGGVGRVEAQRLYRLVSLPNPGQHELELLPAAGTAGYSFTFG
jgi:cytochrome c biogenesis protein CcdA/thiol-disulfide isomerase/thioredoxin